MLSNLPRKKIAEVEVPPCRARMDRDFRFVWRWPGSKAREDLPIERWVRLPRLGGYNPSVAHGLIAYIRCPGLLRFQSHVLIAGHTLARRQPRGSQHLDTVADREDPFFLPAECSHNIQDLGIIPQVLGRPPAQYQHGGIFLDFHLIEGKISFQPVARTLDIGIPARLEIVHDKMQPPARRSRYDRFPSLLLEPVHRVQRFVRFAAVTRYHENL
jgi:hypothetical protein